MEDDIIPEQEDAMRAQSDEDADFNDDLYDRQQDQSFSDHPVSQPRDTLWTFFRNILGLNDSSKVANLDKRELGMLDLSVRSNQQLSNLGGLLDNKDYKEYFMKRSEIILATSMSKRGWLPELVVTQKKFSQRSVLPVKSPSKPGVLGFGKKVENTETIQ